METLQRTNEGQRKKLLDQQERFSKDFDRNQREFEVFKHENELIQRDNEEKIRLSREELQRMAQRLQEKQQEISNLRSMLSQKMQELEIFFNNNQNLQEKSSETNRILLENDLLLSEKKEKAKIIDSLQAQNEALEFQALSNEDGIFATKEKLLLLQRELDSKNSDIYSLKASLNTSDQKLSLLKAEFSQTKEHNKRLEGEKLTMNNKLQECHLAMKNQERKAKEELSNLAKEFDERILVETNIYQRKLKETEAKIHEFEFRERYLKEEKDSKARLLFHKYQSFKEKSVIALKNIKQKLKEYRSLLISFEPAVIFENLSLEFQEKIIGFSGHLTRKIVMERNRVESFYNEERIMLKEKHQKESEDFSYNLKKKDENIQEMVKKDMMALKELENMNRSLINELNRIKPMLKNQEKELISAKNVIERFGKREEDSQSRLNKLEDNYHKEKTKGFNDLELLRNEVDELYSKNKLIFEEFTRNITSLKENQEEELRNMNKNYDEIIDVLKEKVRFYEENEELLNDDKNGQFEKRYEDAENQLKGIKRYYEEQITLLENTHSQILFQNTIETDKNLRNLALKSQEMEKLEAKLKDLENVLKSKNLIIEELSSKNSTIEGKFRNMQFQLELQNKHLNLKPVQISDELSLYKDEMLENPTLMPSNSFKSKHYSKISGMNPLNLEDKSDNFNKRINELKQLSHSISTNPMNTYKELPDEEKKGEPLLLAANMHRYSKSSSNFMQYANKFVGRANINGCNSQRDKVHSDKKATLHKNNQKSSLI